MGKYGDRTPLMADEINYTPLTELDKDAATEETKETQVADVAVASPLVTPAR